MSPIMITVLGWLVSPIIGSLLPKILAGLGFDASNKLQDLEIHIIPELKKTLQAVDQERMMQRGKRVKTDLDALDKMAAMLRHALEDAEDIFDDAQEKIVLRCCHRLYGAFTACIVLCKSSCVWIARVVRTKSAWLLQWARRPEEPVQVNVNAAVVSDEPVQVTIDILATSAVVYGTVPMTIGAAASDEPDPVITSATASDDETVPVSTGAASSDEPDPVTASAAVSHNETVPVTASAAVSVPVTTGAASSDEPDPVATTTSVVASGDETVPVTAGAAASDEPDSVTTGAEASGNEIVLVTTPSDSSGRWLSCLCTSFDFFNSCCASLYSWLVHVFEAACFYRDWSYEVVGIKKCQENSSLFDILDIFLTAISRVKLKKRIQNVENTVSEVKKSPLLGVASNSTPNDIANKNRRGLGAASKREVFGREVLRDDIMARLRETPQGDAASSRTSPCYSVIGIYGVAGSGKTTFAGYVRDYIKEECKEEKLFDTIMCIHVSETFSVEDIFQEMLKDITGHSHSNISDRGGLNKKLKEALCGKRFFLILDDLWVKNKNDQQLEELISPLNVGLKGSKILVTARTKDAVGALCADKPIKMPDLDEDQYFMMFMHYALSGTRVADEEYLSVGRVIARKLHRSPIAAVTVAGRLGANPDIRFWKNTASLNMLNDAMDILWWSYQQLSPDIRRCLEYCNIFPRRFKLKKDHLVRMWIAHGFVKTSCATEEMEDVAEGYIQELLACSFLQPEGTGVLPGFVYFTIHDLLHDLAEKVGGSDYCRIENAWSQREGSWKGGVSRDVRHLFVQNYDAELITEEVLGLENLRTLIIDVVGTDTLVEEKVIGSICKRLPKLRVLAVGCSDSAKQPKFSVPESISQLKHLRFLALRVRTRCMLNALTELRHIQLLDFGHSSWECPSTFADLISLRHIICQYVGFSDVGRLTSLQTIPNFDVLKIQGYEVKQLRELNKLRNFLDIYGLRNVKSKEEALEANLTAKELISHLALSWTSYGGDDTSCCPEVDAEVFEGLCPPVGLELLSIMYYKGSKYPDWMVRKQNGGPKYLQILMFTGCVQLGPAPELQAFPRLRSLWLYDCSWDALPGNIEHLTFLKDLQIVGCKNIRLLPTLPQSVEFIDLEYCNDEFIKSCETVGHPNWQKLEHIPKKNIDTLRRSMKPCNNSDRDYAPQEQDSERRLR